LFGALIVVPAQEALRYSLAGEKAAEARRRALENQDYNLRLGTASVRMDAALNLEYNDNVNLSEAQGQEDFILQPQFNSRLHWLITERNALTASVGVGYAKYFQQPQYDRFVVAPGSELSIDLFVRDFRFNFYDRVSYTQSPIDVGAISGVADYGGLENVAGLNAIWDLNELILTAGYGYSLFRSATGQFEFLDRASHLVLARAAFLLNPTTTGGLEGTAGFTRYDQRLLNDATAYSGGLFVEARLSPWFQAAARVGYVTYSFDQTGALGRAGEPSTYYFGVEVRHILNEYITHSLSGGREVRLGIHSDFEELFFGRWSAAWKIVRDVRLSTQLFYEHGTFPPFVFNDPATAPTILFGETYDRFGAGISVSYPLMEKLSGSVAYRFTLKDSDSARRDYAQNALTILLTYRF
jgi:hypothetical protein